MAVDMMTARASIINIVSNMLATKPDPDFLLGLLALQDCLTGPFATQMLTDPGNLPIMLEALAIEIAAEEAHQDRHADPH